MIFALLILLISSSIHLVAGTFRPEDIPNPNSSKENAALCGRLNVPQSSVCDPKNYMNHESQNVIEGYINAISSKAQIGVVVIDQMSPAFTKKYYSFEDAATVFARNVHDTWGVGDKSLNNGALVFLSVVDRVVHISKGSGLNNKLSDRIIDEIIQSMRQYLRKEQYGKAIESCIVEINLILSGKRKISFFDQPSKPSSSFSSWFEYISGFWPFGLFAAAVGYQIHSARSLHQMEKGKIVLEKFMKDLKDSKTGNKFKTTSCPICMDDFPAESLTSESKTFTSTADHVTSESKSDTTERFVMPTDSNSKPEVIVGEDKNPSRPMALRCGHVFCYTCLTDHFKKSKNNMVCPVCREPVDENAPKPQSRPPPGPGAAPGTGRYGPPNDSQQRTRPSCAETLNTEDLPTYQGSQNIPQQTAQMPAAADTNTGWGSWFRSTGPSSQAYRNNRLDWLEYQFRLQRMRYLYPSLINTHTFRAMNSAIDSQNVDELIRSSELRQVAVERIITDARTRAAAARSGSSGSNYSFGGGRSSGGRSGRW